VDGIRFVAITLVLLQHIHERVLRRAGDVYPEVHSSWLDHLLMQGDAGVWIFFSLSGYILGKSLISRMDSGAPVSVVTFYSRRLTRLEPPYLLVLFGIFLFLTISGFHSSFSRSLNEGASTLTDALIASALYSYGIIYGTLPKLNPPAWSLEVEVQFYLLAPFLAWILTRFRSARRVIGLGACVTLWWFTVTAAANDNSHTINSLLGFMPFFLVGFVVVDLTRLLNRVPSNQKSLGSLMDGLALGSLALLVFQKQLGLVGAFGLMNVVTSGCFVLGVLNGNRIRKGLATPWVAVIGGMCYSIYLIHLPFLEMAANQTAKYGRSLPYLAFFALQFVILSGLVVGAALIFFRFVERPCMDPTWPGRLWRWVRARVGTPNAGP
jgi:peptidoglycan/LPS O-acetylase OafA/YrhL